VAEESAEWLRCVPSGGKGKAQLVTMTATKDMWVANLVEPWKGESSSMPVTEFFESIDGAAEMGKLSSKIKSN